jgi:dTDP-4-dehydrorhamnose 3,5-epimerase
METYKRSAFAAAGIEECFVQENHSLSQRGVLRGLHYQQPPQAQSKLIRVLSGEIFDVAVDIRPDSPTAGRWVGLSLSSANRQMLYVPHWCAHGFCVTSEIAEVVYMTTTEYAPAHESGFMWNDPQLAIEWPLSRPRSGATRNGRRSCWRDQVLTPVLVTGAGGFAGSHLVDLRVARGHRDRMAAPERRPAGCTRGRARCRRASGHGVVRGRGSRGSRGATRDAATSPRAHHLLDGLRRRGSPRACYSGSSPCRQSRTR